MNDLLQKIEAWYDKIKTAGASYQRRGIRPMSDWKIIISTTFIVFCIVASVAFYFYTQIDEGVIFLVQEDASQKAVKLDTTLLKKAVDDMQSRETSLSKIKQNKTAPGDPSL